MRHYTRLKKGNEYRKFYKNDLEKIREDPKLVNLFCDILKDVYYISFTPTENKTKHHIDYAASCNIGYVDTQIESFDKNYLHVISIAYSSFSGFLWIQRFLNEKSLLLQEELEKGRALKKKIKKISDDLKLFRIFCLQFINESAPINIRLTRPYMECLEKCWEEYRMHNLTKYIDGQLETLDKMFNWIEENLKEEWNSKVVLIAFLISLISITAVVAQLISTVDFDNQILDKPDRVLSILLGFLSGIFITTGIFISSSIKRFFKKGNPMK